MLRESESAIASFGYLIIQIETQSLLIRSHLFLVLAPRLLALALPLDRVWVIDHLYPPLPRLRHQSNESLKMVPPPLPSHSQLSNPLPLTYLNSYNP